MSQTQEIANKWYSHPMVKWEVAKAMHYREIGFAVIKEDKLLPPARAFTITNPKYLDYFSDVLGTTKKPTNIYSSTAKVKNIPTFTLNLPKRANSPEMKQFNKDFLQYVTDYDLLIDLDTEGQILPDKVFIQAIGITELLDKYHLEYSIRISGRGIHILLEGHNFPNIPIPEKPAFYKNILFNLKNIMGFTMIDDTIHVDGPIDRRYHKTPYTYDHKSGNICLPLTKTELTTTHKDYTPEYILKNKSIFKRGIPIQNQNQHKNTTGFLEHIQPD